jgi:hypothetical protein
MAIGKSTASPGVIPTAKVSKIQPVYRSIDGDSFFQKEPLFDQ